MFDERTDTDGVGLLFEPVEWTEADATGLRGGVEGLELAVMGAVAW